MGLVLHNNRVKFPKDSFLFCSVHEHGGDDRRHVEGLYVQNGQESLQFSCDFLQSTSTDVSCSSLMVFYAA